MCNGYDLKLLEMIKALGLLCFLCLGASCVHTDKTRKFYRENSSLSVEPMPVKFVYHGSPTCGICELEPRKVHTRSPEEGAVVFATPFLDLASVFMTRWDDSWCKLFCRRDCHDSVVFSFVCKDKTRFMAGDHGGSVYLVSADGFGFDKNRGMRGCEWTKKEKVKTLLEMRFSSALDAMLTFGVRVYFVGDRIFDELDAAKDGAAREAVLAHVEPESCDLMRLAGGVNKEIAAFS